LDISKNLCFLANTEISARLGMGVDEEKLEELAGGGEE